MNDLGHFWAADPERRGEPGFALGLVLPDLTREVAPRARFTGAWLDEQNDAGLVGVVAGVREHLRHDDVWHDLEWFGERRREARRAMEHAGLSGRGLRLFFLDHVLVELTFDHVLLGSVAGLAEDYHRALLGSDVARAALLAGRLPDRPDMEERLRRYVARPRVFYYAEAEGVVEALARVAIRARLRALTDDERVRVLRVTHEVADAMRATLGAVEGCLRDGA